MARSRGRVWYGTQQREGVAWHAAEGGCGMARSRGRVWRAAEGGCGMAFSRAESQLQHPVALRQPALGMLRTAP